MVFQRKAMVWLLKGLSSAILLCTLSLSEAQVGTPDVRQATQGQHGFPFMSTSIGLAENGYIEEEFLISGTALAYLFDEKPRGNGRWKASPNPGVVAPYTVRMIVRRPKSAEHFNGTVLVEWLNVSAGMDVPIEWIYTHTELMREGYAYVGVSAQMTGTTALQAWEDGPEDRYKDIFHPGDSFSYSIFSQSGQALLAQDTQQPHVLGPLAGKIDSLIAIGSSQSSARLFTYYNAVHSQANIYDAFLIHSYIGDPAVLSQSSGGGLPFSRLDAPTSVPKTPKISVPKGSKALIRDDLDTPVLMLLTESDVMFPGMFSPLAVHYQADSRNFRLWEVAGSAHGDEYGLSLMMNEIEKSELADVNLVCGDPPINDGPNVYATKAALHSLSRWSQFNEPPQSAPRMAVNNRWLFPVFIRDAHTGIVDGGIRLPQVSVPVASHTGRRPVGGLFSGVFCSLFGATDYWNEGADSFDGKTLSDPSPSTEPSLHTLYSTHENYMEKTKKAVVDAVQKGYLRPKDAEAILSKAREVIIP